MAIYYDSVKYLSEYQQKLYYNADKLYDILLSYLLKMYNIESRSFINPLLFTLMFENATYIINNIDYNKIKELINKINYNKLKQDFKIKEEFKMELLSTDLKPDLKLSSISSSGYGYGYTDLSTRDNYYIDNTAREYYFRPIKQDLTFSQIGKGNSPSENTIKSFNLTDLNTQYLTGDTIVLKFTSKNKDNIKSKLFFARGFSTAIYSVKLEEKNKNFTFYDNKECIIRIKKFESKIEVDTYLDQFILKYTEDINLKNSNSEFKKYFIDILYYGIITNNSNYYSYLIVPKYDTNSLLMNKLSISEKKTSLINTIKMLKEFNSINKFIDDLKITNISIDNNLEPILIDYDIDTIKNEFDDNIIPEYVHTYFNDINNYKKLDKIYQILLTQMIYQFYFLGKYNDNTSITKSFNDVFTKEINNPNKYRPNKYRTLKDPLDLNIEYNKLLEDNNFLGVENILFKNNKGLLSQQYDDILNLDEVLVLLDNIFDKPTKQTWFPEETIKKIKLYIPDSSIYFVNKYGTGVKYYENPNLYKFNFQSLNYYDKPRRMHYYLRVNNWDIIYHDTADSATVTDNTLKYALQSVGCIHSIEMFGQNKNPKFTIHLNKEFKNIYGDYYDNCRVLENEQWVLFFWLEQITDMFNMLTANYNINKKIYINIHDHPIYKDSDIIIGTDVTKHPFPNMDLHLGKSTELKIPITVNPDINFKIYCWPAKKNYRDIGLPFHDIWMHLFGYDFGLDFNIDNYNSNLSSYVNKKLDEKEPKAFFRGSYTNCAYPMKNSVRLIGHLKTLQNNENIIDSYVVGGPQTFRYQHFDKSSLNVSNIQYWMETKKYFPAQQQPKFRYILNLDGFASAFRIIKELYFNSIIIIPDSPFTDVIRDVLIPWKHFIPCNGDLSNIVETINWCNNNLDKMNIILQNMQNLRDSIISVDNMLDVTYKKIISPDFLTAQQIMLTDGIIDTSLQQSIIPPIINNDVITPLGITANIKWNNGTSDIRTEDIYYKKYLKYKQKYLSLKK